LELTGMGRLEIDAGPTGAVKVGIGGYVVIGDKVTVVVYVLQGDPGPPAH
jgi:hypothetical protein